MAGGGGFPGNQKTPLDTPLDMDIENSTLFSMCFCRLSLADELLCGLRLNNSAFMQHPSHYDLQKQLSIRALTNSWIMQRFFKVANHCSLGDHQLIVSPLASTPIDLVE